MAKRNEGFAGLPERLQGFAGLPERLQGTVGRAIARTAENMRARQAPLVRGSIVVPASADTPPEEVIEFEFISYGKWVWRDDGD